MKNYIITIFVCWLSVLVKAQGQEVSFISSVVEEGIRQHLCISEDEVVSFAQLDTITFLDLSRRGVTDIQDLVLLPKLRSLDISDNRVNDLKPLSVLDSLEWVDLSYNNLKGINDLFFSTAKKLTVNVAFNYIQDFSLFGSMSSCNFILEGVGLQLIENAPYFDVCQFICDASAKPFTIHGLVRTNMEEEVLLVCEEKDVVVPVDGDYFKQSLQYMGNATVPVIVTNGEQSDTTWVVPSHTFQIESLGSLAIETGLPEKYNIKIAYAKKGTVIVNGTSINYTASNDFDTDTLYISYYDGMKLRGFTEYYLVNPEAVHLGDVNMDGIVNIVDLVMTVNYILNIEQSNFHIENADMDLNNDINVTDVIMMVNKILDK